jgi:hypothetical protein
MSAHIRVNSTDTIHTLKLKVMEQLDIPPSRQQLIYHGETLGVDEMTLAASEITPKSRIYVQILEAKGIPFSSRL